MSEEILKALMQLFALITKQDGGVEESEKAYVRTFLSKQLSSEDVNQYYSLFEKYAGPVEAGSNLTPEAEQLTPVRDSVKVLGICRKINKTLHQNQKIVVLVRLFELVNADRKFTPQRMAIIQTVSDVFKVPKQETSSIETFVTSAKPSEIVDPFIWLFHEQEESHDTTLNQYEPVVVGTMVFLHVPSAGLYFFKYSGEQELFLNGLSIQDGRIYLFANGSTVKLPRGKPLYYSDVVSHFLHKEADTGISLRVDGLNHRFAGGNVGLRNINFSEEKGSLVGIMGASGAGKTTLLNILSGNIRPTEGSVRINGLDLHSRMDKLKGVIGLIPQDDLLIEELTVFQNLYYNASLCFRKTSKKDLHILVNKTLLSLGLQDIQDLKVGTPYNKLISGGQRKRLNVALELLREPSILFVDEPTSGLSSRDSENVMDLLRELALKGKLVFVVIHQPSSEIYKMFDRIIILDTGGYMIYHGNPVEAVIYFKKLDEQINAEIGECPTCGNVYPEIIFNIIEARVVDEFGNYTGVRKVLPEQWEELYHKHHVDREVAGAASPPPGKLSPPGWFRQFSIYWIRDLLSKISNRQYLGLTLLVSPVLALILSYIIRYIADPTSTTYIFRENENIPIYIFMSLIVALFLGLIVSAEEIFKDRKILKREAFLNLSRSGYLLSKVFILIFISAIQCLLFVIIANPILGIKGMTFAYWLALFSTAVCANILGLNISAAFNSAITIYIVIPMLMIPMMILSGAMFSYDKLNRKVGSVGKVPWIAEIMIPKWSYEALMVHQFKDNRFMRTFYTDRKAESVADFHQVYLLPELKRRLQKVKQDFARTGSLHTSAMDLELLHNEFSKLNILVPEKAFHELGQMTPEGISGQLLQKMELHLDAIKNYYSQKFIFSNTQLENRILYYMENQPLLYNQVKDDHHNERVEEYVRKVYEKNKMVEYRNTLIQQIDPIYLDPVPEGPLSFRSHFFAPRKYFMGRYFDTFWFNIGFIWFLSLLFYISLYFNLVHNFILLTQKVK